VQAEQKPPPDLTGKDWSYQKAYQSLPIQTRAFTKVLGFVAENKSLSFF
jgi:hypothetical protein